MNHVATLLRRVTEDLAEIGGRMALVGGLAVSARAEPRFTRDLDFAVAVASDVEAERIIFLMQGLGYIIRTVLEHQATGRLATVRLLPRSGVDDEALADLLFASTGIEGEIVGSAENLELLPGLWVPVASLGHLIAMKVLSHDAERRPKDATDILGLLSVALPQDLAEAREALTLITQRGYHRGKKLEFDLDGFIERFARRA